jgi:hypothetical protein
VLSKVCADTIGWWLAQRFDVVTGSTSMDAQLTFLAYD